MSALYQIESPLSAPWCGWTMLVLLICAVLSELFQPGVISQAKNSLLAQTDRTYKDSPINFMGQFMQTFFRLGTVSMAVYLCCTPTNAFTFLGFGIIFAILFIGVLVKMLCNRCIDATFLLSKLYGDAYEHYGNIVTLAMLVLYPTVLVLLRVDTLHTTRWTVAAVAALFVLTWTYRAFRQFVTSPRKVLYLLAYIATMEVLPMAILYKLSDKILSML